MSFQGFLRQSTAVDVILGPFVDSTDGDTEETALTIAQADVRLSKNGQPGAQKNDVTSCAHDADGFYNCELDATDTDTVGQLTIYVHVAGALCVRMDYHVVEEAVYDSMYGSSAAGPLQSTIAGRTLDVTATGAAGIDCGNIENPSTAVDLSATDIQLCDTVTTNTDMITAAAVNAEVDTALADIHLDHLFAAANGDTAVNDSYWANLVSATADASTFVASTDSLQAIRDRGDSAWTTGAGGTTPQLLQETTIATLSTQTNFTLTAGSADDNAYNNCMIVIEDASTGTQKAIGIISDYTGLTKTVTLAYDPGIFTMAATDKVYILVEADTGFVG